MKPLLLCLLLASLPMIGRTHDHVEVRLISSSQLSFIPTATNTRPFATYFPPYEKPSYDLSAFPGGTYATLLTFSAFENNPAPAGGVFVFIRVLSVSGPVGGSFSFWEVGADTPTWTRPAGWVAPGGVDPQPFNASEVTAGYGHVHDRVFTMNKAGVYDVTFQAVDIPPASPPRAPYTASAPFTVRFIAIDPPKLSISKVNDSIKLSFTSRPEEDLLSYDIQRTTTLNAHDWTTIETLSGDGGTLEFTDPIAGRPRAFYRLVEY